MTDFRIERSGGGGSSIGTAIGGGTSGSVLFVDSSGNLAQDNSNLFWDDTNNRLGIGINSPGWPLEVIGTTDNFGLGPLYVKSLSGSIGVALTLDASSMSGGKAYSFLATGPGASAGTGGFAIYNSTDGRYESTQLSTGHWIFARDFFTDLGQVGIKPNSSSVIGLAVRGATSQSANLTEWQNSIGTNLVSIAADGAISTAATGTVSIGSSAPIYPGRMLSVTGTGLLNDSQMVIKDATAGNVITLNASGYSGANPYMGTINNAPFYFVTNNAYRFGALASGGFSIGGTYYSSDPGDSNLAIEGNTGMGVVSAGAKLHVVSSGASNTVQIIKGASSQSANLTEWKNNSNTVMTVVDPAGNVGIGATSPSYPLHISTSSANPVYVDSTYASTRIGINNTSTFPNTGLYLSENGTPQWSIASYSGGTFTFFKEGVGEAIGISAARLMSIHADFNLTDTSSRLLYNTFSGANYMYAGSASNQALILVEYAAQSVNIFETRPTYAGATHFAITKDGAFIANEDGLDTDCRIEGDTDANLFYTDAGNDRVGIGTSAPATKLEISGTGDIRTRMTFTTNGGLEMYSSGTFRGGFIYDGGGGVTSFYGPNTSGAIQIDSTPHVGCGGTPLSGVKFLVIPEDAAVRGIGIKAASAQSANLFEVFDSSINSIDYISSSGLLAVRAGATAAGANFAKVGGTIFNSFTDTSTTHTDGTEDDLYSYTLPASIFGTNGDSVEEKEHAQFVSSATAARRLKKYFAGTLVFDSGALTLTLGGDFILETTVIRESSSVVRVSVSVVTTSASSVPYATYTRITGLTLTNTQILKTTGIASGAGAASGDIINKYAKLLWSSAA